MASYNELNALIDAYINRNGVQAITGQILNGVLKAMVEQLGRGYTIMGAAIPTTDPGTPDGPECYFASETGTYTDFDGLQIVPGELALLCYTPSDGWTKATIYEGFQEVQATIDGNVGTPSVGVSYANGVLSFDFHNMKGNPGQNGQDGAAAGFGTIGADITGSVGTPGVTVESSGPATAKNLQFHFTNLKGETGVTSVVATVDNTTGTPACTVSLVGQQLTLAFSGLKGAQGDTGSSVDYPFTIVNNLTTDDATQALSAAQGVVLAGQVSQLEAKVTDLQDGETVLQQQIDAIQPVVIEGNVTNAPDNEDITATPDNRLKFKDRPATLTNKGYKILRADKTFASQVTDINTIYEVRYKFDLIYQNLSVAINENDALNPGIVRGLVYYASEEKVTIPAGKAIILPHNTALFLGDQWGEKRNYVKGYYLNDSDEDKSYYLGSIGTDTIAVKIVEHFVVPSGCALFFNGGNITNASLNFNGAYLYGDIQMDNVRGLGKISNEYVNPEWLGAKGDGLTNDTLAIRSALDVCDHIVFPDKTYLVTCGFPNSWNSPFVDYWGLVINRSNVILDCGKARFICDIIGGVTSTNTFTSLLGICGNGYDKDNYTTTERISGVVVNGGTFIGSRSQFNIPTHADTNENYSTIFHIFTEGTIINGVTVLDSCGDAITQYGTRDSHIINCSFKRARRTCINMNTRTVVEQCRFEEYVCDYTYPNGNESKVCPSAFGLASENQSYEVTTQEWINGWIARDNFFQCDYSGRPIEISAFDVVVKNNKIELNENARAIGNPVIGCHTESACPGYNILIQGNCFIHKGTPTNWLYAVGCVLPNTSVIDNRVQGFMALRIWLATGLVFSGNVCSSETGSRFSAFSFESTAVGDSTKEIVISDNYFDGYEKIVQGSPSGLNGTTIVLAGNTIRYNDTSHYLYLFDAQTTFNSVVSNNDIYVESYPQIILTKIPASSTYQFLFKNNTFRINAKTIIVSSTNNTYYGNGSFIGNVFENSAANVVKLEPNVAFTGKMAVIGNIFKGTMDGLTTQTTSDASLVVENNFAI